MLKIGITGGIGSGKTIVCKIFSQLGIPVYNADTAAKQLMHTDHELISKIKLLFGETIYNSNNELNKKLLAQLIFNDEQALAAVNNCVHPAVAKDFENWIGKQINVPYILKEAAILFESGANKNLDYVITVSAPEDIRISRVLLRDQVSEQDVKRISKNQLSENEKIKLSDFEIKNDDSELVIPQVIELHTHLLSLSENKK